MARTIFSFSRLRMRQARNHQHGRRQHPNLYQAGATATETTSASHEAEPDDEVVVEKEKGLPSFQSEGIFPSRDDLDELDRMIVQLPSTQKAANDKLSRTASGSKPHNRKCHGRQKKKPKKEKRQPEPKEEELKHPPSQSVVLELQNTVDFLSTKLQQSESHVKALQAQNEQFQSFFDKFLAQQEREFRKNGKADLDSADESMAPEDTDAQEGAGLLGRLGLMQLQWPSFVTGNENGTEKDNETNMSMGSDMQTTVTKPTQSSPSVFTPFTKEDAIGKMAIHYQGQVDKLLDDKMSLQQQIHQLKVQNRVQEDTMSSLERQISTDRQQHRSFFDQDEERENKQNHMNLRTSSSRISKTSSTRRAKEYWQELDQQRMDKKRAELHKEAPSPRRHGTGVIYREQSQSSHHSIRHCRSNRTNKIHQSRSSQSHLQSAKHKLQSCRIEASPDQHQPRRYYHLNEAPGVPLEHFWGDNIDPPRPPLAPVATANDGTKMFLL